MSITLKDLKNKTVLCHLRENYECDNKSCTMYADGTFIIWYEELKTVCTEWIWSINDSGFHIWGKDYGTTPHKGRLNKTYDDAFLKAGIEQLLIDGDI